LTHEHRFLRAGEAECRPMGEDSGVECLHQEGRLPADGQAFRAGEDENRQAAVVVIVVVGLDRRLHVAGDGHQKDKVLLVTDHQGGRLTPSSLAFRWGNALDAPVPTGSQESLRPPHWSQRPEEALPRRQPTKGTRPAKSSSSHSLMVVRRQWRQKL
jgi:hypothetical protein